MARSLLDQPPSVGPSSWSRFSCCRASRSRSCTSIERRTGQLVSAAREDRRPDAQMERLKPFFPKSHGKPRVDGRRQAAAAARRLLSESRLTLRQRLPRGMNHRSEAWLPIVICAPLQATTDPSGLPVLLTWRRPEPCLILQAAISVDLTDDPTGPPAEVRAAQCCAMVPCRLPGLRVTVLVSRHQGRPP